MTTLNQNFEVTSWLWHSSLAFNNGIRCALCIGSRAIVTHCTDQLKTKQKRMRRYIILLPADLEASLCFKD